MLVMDGSLYNACHGRLSISCLSCGGSLYHVYHGTAVYVYHGRLSMSIMDGCLYHVCHETAIYIKDGCLYYVYHGTSVHIMSIMLELRISCLSHPRTVSVSKWWYSLYSYISRSYKADREDDTLKYFVHLSTELYTYFFNNCFSIFTQCLKYVSFVRCMFCCTALRYAPPTCAQVPLHCSCLFSSFQNFYFYLPTLLANLTFILLVFLNQPILHFCNMPCPRLCSFLRFKLV